PAMPGPCAAGPCAPCLPRLRRGGRGGPGAGRRRPKSLTVSTRFLSVHSRAARLLERLPSPLSQGRPADWSAGSRKLVYLVRHAEAAHNVREREAQLEARRCGCTDLEVEQARKHALHDPAFLDACLSTDGLQQVQMAATSFQELLGSTHYVAPEVVLVSPLTRALQTASTLFPGHKNVCAQEFLREKRTGEACDERKPAREIESEFPHVDVSDIAAEDAAGPDGHRFREQLRETNEQVGQRAACLLDAVQAHEGKAIAVVTHKGFLRELARGPLRGALGLEGGRLPTVFGNAEVRVCEVSWDSAGRLEEVLERTLQEVTEAPPMEVCAQASPASPRRCGGREPCGQASGGLCVAVGTSSERGAAPAQAAADAWRTMQARLGGPPSVALVFCDPAVEPAEVARALRPLAGAAFVVGGTSCRGVLSASGPRSVGVLGLRSFAHRCSVGSVEDITSGSARKQTAEAAKRAAGRSVPDMVFVCSSPGFEEDVLAGIDDALGSVPVVGWSAAGDISSPLDQHWWQLVGSIAGWHTISRGAVFACLWIFDDASVSSQLSHCFAPTEHKGRITRAEGRLVAEIDGRPAAEVLNEWTGGALRGKLAGGNVMEDAGGPAGPLAVHHGRCRVTPKLACMRAVHENGQVSFFATVPCGEGRLLGFKSSDQSAALLTAVRMAREEVDFAVRGALISVGAGCAIDLQILRGALSDLPEVLCCFPFGQQGMIGDVACHGNMMINILLFG
ncbi:unnamed protein product, partial [Prorocentrum cordatum]